MSFNVNTFSTFSQTFENILAICATWSAYFAKILFSRAVLFTFKNKNIASCFVMTLGLCRP